MEQNSSEADSSVSTSWRRYLNLYIYSGARAARRAAKRSPIVITEKKRKPMNDFLMIIMASGITRGRVRTTRTTTTTESRNMAAIQKIGWQTYSLGLPCNSLILDIRCYDQLTPVKTSYPLTSISWPYRGLKFTVHRGHVFLWSRPLTKCCFSHWIAGSCQLTCWK